MWKTKLRLFTVIALISMSIWAGASMIEHTKNLDLIYEDIYVETNLADVYVDISGDFENSSNLENVCNDFSELYQMNHCESILAVQGTTVHELEGTQNFLQL